MEWKVPYKQLFCFDLFSVQYNKEETFTIRIWLYKPCNPSAQEQMDLVFRLSLHLFNSIDYLK